MQEIKAIIFDLDGVIVDTAVFHYHAWKKLANEMGFDFTLEQNERLKGISRLESLDILFEIGKIEKKSAQELDQLADKKNKWYRDKILMMTPKDVLPGVKNFLLDLKNSKYKIAIGSSSKNANTILERIGFDGFFDSVVDGLKISKSKPDPEVFLTAANELNIKPEHCLVFEDAAAGIEAAKTAGMLAIGVGKYENLSNADKIIPDFSNMNVLMINNLTN
ncbi:MAG: beta-phosphoglucomutase [Bacteroidales bacterium]|jgi:beta-phosphoglucomutase|nr:beta-phosphoglucomutase [Bacteroidales bacterium]